MRERERDRTERDNGRVKDLKKPEGEKKEESEI